MRTWQGVQLRIQTFYKKQQLIGTECNKYTLRTFQGFKTTKQHIAGSDT